MSKEIEPDFEVRDCGYSTECWVWLKWKSSKGYGKTSFDGRKRWAHRVYFELFNNVELDSHEQLDHKCENESCVNPDHLEVVDNLENQKRRARLTQAMASEIRALQGKLSQQKIAERFGISRRYVRDIHAGRIAEWQ